MVLTYYRIFDSRKRAEKHVDSFPAIANALQIIRQSSGSLTKVVGYYVMPDGWLIKKSLLTFDFAPLSSVCWVYDKDTKHYVNFIPTNTEHGLVVKLRSGKTLSESYRGNARDEKLWMLRRVAPWAVFGYSEQLENAWRKDREAFAVEIDRRRRVLVRPQEGA